MSLSVDGPKWLETSGDYFATRDNCPVCFGTHLSTLFSAPYTDPTVRGHVMSHYKDQGTVSYEYCEGIDFTIYKCYDCALIFQRMAPIGPMLDILYGRFIDPEILQEREHSRLTLDNFYEVGRRLGDLFRTISKEPKDITFLDFGFGYGRWGRVAKAMGARVFATEITPEKISFARSLGIEVLTEAELPQFQFDVVHAEQVFEHLADPARVFEALSTCVAERGVFKIAAPKQGRIEHLLKAHGFIDWSPFATGFKRGHPDYQTLIPLEHVNSFCRKPIECLASRAGFVVRKGSFGSRHLDLDFGSAGSILRSGGQWAARMAKDIYNHAGPGRQDSSCYLLYRR